VNPLTCYFGWGDGPETSQRQEERLENSIDPTIVDSSYGRESVLLYSPLYDENREKYLKEKLDSLCPKVKKSKTLEEKALRIVMSVGVDAVVLDSDLSAAMGKFKLKPRDMLASRDTDDVFGAFYVSPEEIEEVGGGLRASDEEDELAFEEFERSLGERGAVVEDTGEAEGEEESASDNCDDSDDDSSVEDESEDSEDEVGDEERK
jgi:hypothetical protein